VKFLCGSCRTKYQISDEKVRGKILTIRCKKCGAKILVRESLARDGSEGTVVAPLADQVGTTSSPQQNSPLSDAFNRALATHETHDIPVAATSQPPEVAHEWYTAIDGQQFGPFSFEQVEQQIQNGQLIGRHYVWHEGMDNWTRIRDVPLLERHLPATTIPPPPLPPPEPTRLEAAAPPSAEEGPAGALFSHDLGASATAAQPIPVSEGAEAERPSESSSELPAGEDLFASVPRASAAELVPKESTRFFVKAAGVGGAKSKNRLALAFGVTVVLMLIGFVAAWVSGVIRVELPGIGNPFDRGERRANLYDGESEDPNAIKGFLSGEDRRKREEAARASRESRRRDRRERAGSEAASAFEYVDAEDYEETLRSRGADDVQGIEIGELGTSGAADGKTVVDAELPASDLAQVPAVDRTTLSPADIQRTINSRKRSVKICYEQSLRGQDSLRGKLEIRVTIAPSGDVADTAIETPAFKGSRIGKCIAEKIAEWRFPRFEGEPQTILVPFILERTAY
jgi:predicted Zn finger-like uncharacterized protein